MDHNYVRYRQQIELMLADRATSTPAEHAHRSMAREYTRQMRDHRRSWEPLLETATGD